MPRLSALEVIQHQRANMRRVNTHRMQEVAAASLHRLQLDMHKAAAKQEPPSVGANEGSTAPHPGQVDRRAASAQSDRTG